MKRYHYKPLELVNKLMYMRCQLSAVIGKFINNKQLMPDNFLTRSQISLKEDIKSDAGNYARRKEI